MSDKKCKQFEYQIATKILIIKSRNNICDIMIFSELNLIIRSVPTNIDNEN